MGRDLRDTGIGAQIIELSSDLLTRRLRDPGQRADVTSNSSSDCQGVCVPVPRLAANNTPIATLQYPTRTGEICEQLAAVEGELTAIKAVFVETLIISFGMGARWGPASQIQRRLKER
jgi:hypothetical protein